MPPTLVALTRELSPTIGDCELTHVPRQPIDVERARAQHWAYEAGLRDLGCEVRRVAPAPGLPDAVFVEDAAVVLDEVAVITRPGAASRRAETASVASALAALRRLAHIEEPATLDGGDVLVVGRRVFAGLSSRTNAEGVAQLRALLGPLGLAVEGVPVRGCLHLKSAVTAFGPEALLLNPAWVDGGAFAGLEQVHVDPAEPLAANCLRVGDTVLFPAAFPRTRRLLEERGVAVRTLDVSELARAEGALTCCSLLVPLGTPA
ncbi:MAG TPA: arginine deiminase-related protein [Vicinamibacteria bacterium]|nr:arginine deiminase-related protein [Vicinamibacteria bacterium]